MPVTKPTANEVFRAENWAWGLFFAFKEPTARWLLFVHPGANFPKENSPLPDSSFFKNKVKISSFLLTLDHRRVTIGHD